jgi:hypothetical protein
VEGIGEMCTVAERLKYFLGTNMPLLDRVCM